MNDFVALTRAVGQGLAKCQLTFLEREPIDVAAAAAQHEIYCDALRAAGITVKMLPADEERPDAVFVEDAAVVLDEIAIITRPGTSDRRLEVPAIAGALSSYRQTVHIGAPATLEGGDVLKVGRTIFVGLSSRTNREGFAQFSAIVKQYGYQTVPVKVHDCLHLKTAVTAPDDDTLLLNPKWIGTDQLNGFRCLEVPADEPFAANTLALNGVVHLSARWTQTREILEQRGFTVRSLNISEFEKAEAGLTCLSLIFKAGPEFGRT